MQIQLTLVKPLIVEAVKTETFLHGNFVKSTDQNGSTTALAYNTQAGDEEYALRKIDRDIRYAVEKLKTVFVDYITPSPIVKGDDSVTSSDDNKNIIYHLTVSTRWNGTLTDACARLSQRYIIDCAVAQWYISLGDTKQAEYYGALLKQDEIEVRKCFIKLPPQAPSLQYSTNISFVSPSITDGAIHLTEGDNVTFTYTLDDGAIDDIETRSSDPSVVRTCLDTEGKWLVKALRPGFATVTFFSRHHDTVRAVCDVNVISDPTKTTQHVDPSVDPLFPNGPYR